MDFVQQTAYEWPLALYLFCGGLGGATLAAGILAARASNRAGAWARFVSAAGIVLFGIGGLALVFFDLLSPFKAYLSILRFPSAGISVDVVLIALACLGAFVYGWPHWAEVTPLPWLDWLKRISGLGGWVAVVAGGVFPLISSLILAEPAAIPLWHNGGLPALLVVNSYAGAFGLLLAFGAWQQPDDADDLSLTWLWGGLVVALILQVVVLYAYWQVGNVGPEAARLSWQWLGSSLGFAGGALVAGLGLPLLAGFYALARKVHGARTLAVTAAALILIGGYLMRHFIIEFGAYVNPWKF